MYVCRQYCFSSVVEGRRGPPPSLTSPDLLFPSYYVHLASVERQRYTHPFRMESRKGQKENRAEMGRRQHAVSQDGPRAVPRCTRSRVRGERGGGRSGEKKTQPTFPWAPSSRFRVPAPTPIRRVWLWGGGGKSARKNEGRQQPSRHTGSRPRAGTVCTAEDDRRHARRS